MKSILSILIGLIGFVSHGWSQNPALGAHALAAYPLGRSTNLVIFTPALNTQPSGSTVLVCLGRGNKAAFANVPTDNKDNPPCRQLGATHSYALWAESGTALYAFPLVAGGSGHVISAGTSFQDEVTLTVVEIKDGGVVQDYKWNEVLKGNPLTSLPVTATGPATLVAYWWGDGDVGFTHAATPADGFTVIESFLPPGALVQAAVATKEVTTAGTYHVTWDSAGNEGAQLWLVAIQKASAVTNLPSPPVPSKAGVPE